ncbi:MAG: sigma-70 family RNA polymerase sigma factor [Planctomycetota bacterium]
MNDSRISNIETRWTTIRQAHGDDSHSAQALETLVQRYGPAVRKYLLAALKNEEAADEVFQEFALRLTRGDFKNADAEKGRFRSMIKTAVYHLIIDWHRRRAKLSRHSSEPLSQLRQDDVSVSEEADEAFLNHWRGKLLDDTWDRLQQMQQQTGKPYFDVLRFRADLPDHSMQQLRQVLSDHGCDVGSTATLRVTLHRSRKRFSALLIQQVRDSLANASDDAVEEEMITLGLHHLLG